MMNCAKCALRQICTQSQARHIPLTTDKPVFIEKRKWEDFLVGCLFLAVPLFFALLGFTFTEISGLATEFEIHPVIVQATPALPLAQPVIPQTSPPIVVVEAEKEKEKEKEKPLIQNAFAEKH